MVPWLELHATMAPGVGMCWGASTQHATWGPHPMCLTTDHGWPHVGHHGWCHQVPTMWSAPYLGLELHATMAPGVGMCWGVSTQHAAWGPHPMCLTTDHGWPHVGHHGWCHQVPTMWQAPFCGLELHATKSPPCTCVGVSVPSMPSMLHGTHTR
jgi:hypothetical protein